LNLISGPSTVKSINKLNAKEIDKDTILTISADENVQPLIKTGGYFSGLYLATIKTTSGKNINNNDIQKMYFIRFYPRTNYLSIRVYTVLELKKLGLWVCCFIR
jgi:uncharacterized membrane protein